MDESLLPVLERISERNNRKQTLISSYFPKATSSAPPLAKIKKKKSKRVTRAIFGLTQSLQPVEDAVAKTKRKRTKKTASKTATKRAATKHEVKLSLSESSSSDSS